jgi:hypothetical protein
MALRRKFSLLASALLAASFLAVLPSPAAAAGSIPTGAIGSDISWPQCGLSLASPNYYAFGVVGVTGGHPFSANGCFADEFAWARSNWLAPQLYLNLDYGLRQDGPLTCGVNDIGCQAYNYGYDSASWAHQFAHDQTAGASDSVGIWWLDVETGNYWNDSSTDANSYVIQGALDYLQRTVGTTAGVYSTPWMWAELAGSFAPPNTPNWVAGANGLDDVGKCSASLWPGGQVWAIQYLNFDIDLDQNLGC